MAAFKTLGQAGRNNSMFPEKIGSSFESHYRRALAEQVAIEFEQYYQPLKAWVAVRVHPSLTRLSLLFQDITQHEQTEINLLVSAVFLLPFLVSVWDNKLIKFVLATLSTRQ